MADEARGHRGARIVPERIGRYDVFPAFAHGGMASVHVGRLDGPSAFSKIVAIKRLNPVFATSDKHARMLVEEAKVTARIRSPYVVPVLEMVHEDGQLCIVMELVLGVSLATLLSAAAERGEPPPPAIASAIVADALRGLHAAHEATSAAGKPLEIIHRDVSPQNVLVGADGIARVLDFGVARALGREPLSSTGEVLGKMAYMAPEQLRAAPLTRRADVYAAGVVLWEALTGTRMRQGDSPLAITAHALGSPPAPSSVAPSISPELDAVVLTALAHDEHRRWPTAEAMAHALEEVCPPAAREDVARFVERIAGSELERLGDAVSMAERHVPPPPVPAAASAPPHRSLAKAAGIALVAVVSIATAAVLAARGGPASKIAQPPPSIDAPASSRSETPLASVSAAAVAPTPAVPSASTSASAGPRGAKAGAKGSVPSRTPSRTSSACTPPYDFDERGIKHYKPGCIP